MNIYKRQLMTNIIKNIFKTKIYLFSIIIFLPIIISIPFLFQKLIIPSFEKQIIENILDEAKRVAKHLSNSIDFQNLTKEELDLLMTQEMHEFQINKIHFFDKNGKVIYSTVSNKIGDVNKHSYFHNIVAKGEVYYKIKNKGAKSSEQEQLTSDIIEIYLPIIKGSLFNSAFELYYDISKEIYQFKSLSNLIMRVNFIIAILFSIFLLTFIYILSKKNLEKKTFLKDLEYLANNDPLTDLFNRRFFYKVANQLVKLQKRTLEPLSLTMIDIDNFKNINDQYGHQIGDHILKTIANELKNITRETDIVVRYGGEEFIILYPNTDINGAEIISKKICEYIKVLNFEKVDNLNITISLGVSECYDGNINNLIDRADEALYKAKKQGKNRVICQ